MMRWGGVGGEAFYNPVILLTLGYCPVTFTCTSE